MNTFKNLWERRDAKMLLLVLLVALLYGLLYVFLVPPWQHYDEPSHFEVAWLTARRGTVPQLGDETDLEIRRAIAISMRAHEFFRDAGFEPPLEENGNIWLGQTQFGNLPLYYYLAAIPVRLLENQGIDAMLYGARLLSLFFLLLSVLACWGIVVEFTPAGHRMRFLLPLGLALLPGYVDVMTAANNDTLAACLAALALWAALRLIRRGFSIVPFLAVCLLAVLIYFSKETAYPVYLLLFVAMPLMLARGRFAALRPWIWGGVFTGVVIFLAWAMMPGDAAAWYRVTTQALPTRTDVQPAVVGNYVFQFDPQAPSSPDWFNNTAVFQPMPLAIPDRNEVYTLGVWAWTMSSSPNAVQETARLTLGFGFNRFSNTFTLTPEPTFLVITGTMTPEQFMPFRLLLGPGFHTSSGSRDQLVFMDGVVLAKGEYPSVEPPEYEDAQGSSGSWGGRSFTNLVRNGSAELGGLRFRPLVDHLVARFLPDRTQPSLLLTSFLDWPGSQLYYSGAAEWLLTTFWGMFGWAHVPLLGSPPRWLFAGYTFIAVLATALWTVGALFGRNQSLHTLRSEALFLVLALVLPWMSTLLRAPLYLGLENLYLPVARYALAAAIPTVFVLNLGLLQIYGALDRKFSARGWITAGAFIGGWLLFALYAILSIRMFYA